ncbi:hypothetical protein ZWY2020_040754 [Hordeum vulgare]|nr:hypothetical protein ZWY2020_040754 [Hordeum vulgare]
MENCIFGICNNAMGERRELNPRMVDSQSTALIHLASSAPYPAKGFFFFFPLIIILFILTSVLRSRYWTKAY